MLQMVMEFLLEKMDTNMKGSGKQIYLMVMGMQLIQTGLDMQGSF